MEFLYQDGDMYHFMNNETYEQIGLSGEVLGDAVSYLIPNIKLEDRDLRGSPGRHRPAPDGRDEGDRDRAGHQGGFGLERGQAREDGDRPGRPGPAFINEGDVIRIDTATGSYIERAK